MCKKMEHFHVVFICVENLSVQRVSAFMQPCSLHCRQMKSLNKIQTLLLVRCFHRFYLQTLAQNTIQTKKPQLMHNKVIGSYDLVDEATHLVHSLMFTYRIKPWYGLYSCHKRIMRQTFACGHKRTFVALCTYGMRNDVALGRFSA